MFKISGLSNTVTNLNHRQLPEYERLQALQVGDYKLSVRSSDVNGWLVCDGRSLSRAEYPELFAIIGTDFGSANVNSFNLPDFTSKVIGMFGLSAISEALTERNRGDDVGTETVTLTVPQMPTHSHTGTTASSGAHTHGVDNIPYGTQNITAAGGAGITACDETTHTISTNSAGDHTHTFTTATTGSSEAHNNMQPTLFGVSVLIFSKFKNFVTLTPMQFK